MNKPTPEQIKEFWERCDTNEDCWNCHGETSAYSIMGTCSVCKGTGELKLQKLIPLPDIDLNNLFKYAVPKLWYMELKVAKFHKYHSAMAQFESSSQPKYSQEQDPALALFWAIWEVIHADKKG